MPPNLRDLLRQLEVRFEKGDVLFTEGEDTHELYILLDGAVEIRKSDRAVAVVREKNTYLGEMSTLLGTRRTASAVAVEPCRMVRVPDERVPDFFSHSPELGLKLARMLAKRLLAMNDKYDRMLQDAVSDAEMIHARGVFKRITVDPLHRSFLAIYCQRVGEEMSIDDLLSVMDTNQEQLHRILETFTRAGLIERVKGNIAFLEARDKGLRHQILNWVPL
jgi:CRP-like cAMP-binding protein